MVITSFYSLAILKLFLGNFIFFSFFLGGGGFICKLHSVFTSCYYQWNSSPFSFDRKCCRARFHSLRDASKTIINYHFRPPSRIQVGIYCYSEKEWIRTWRCTNKKWRQVQAKPNKNHPINQQPTHPPTDQGSVGWMASGSTPPPLSLSLLISFSFSRH